MGRGWRGWVRGGWLQGRALVGALVFLPFLALPSARAVSLGGAGAELGVSLTAREVIEANRATTHERTLTKARFAPRFRPLPWIRWFGSVVVTHGGPTIHARSEGVYRLREVFQNRSPAVDWEEAFLDARWKFLDVRLGKQRIAWGKLDRFSPTDVLNTFSYVDPFVLEEGERRIGAPAAVFSWNVPVTRDWLDEPRVSFVWVPLYLPFRFSDASCEVAPTGTTACRTERWFPPAGLPPQVFVLPEGLLQLPNGLPSPEVRVPVSFRVRNVAPRARLEDGSFGARLSATVEGVDAAAYYFHGYDNQPAFRLRAWATGTPDADPRNPLHVRNLVAHTVLEPRFQTIDLWGLDVARAFERFTVRAEAAYVSGRPFSRDLRGLIRDPTSLRPQLLGALAALGRGAGAVPVELPPSAVTRDAVEWGAGVDVLLHSWLFLLQVNQTNLLRNETPLLIENVETRALLTARKAWLGSRLQLYLLSGQGFESGYSFARPRLQYRWRDGVTTEVGYLWIAGSPHSVIGQYRRNDQAWVALLIDF